MPSAVVYVPPTDPERNQFSFEVERERRTRRERYVEALAYYKGDHPNQLAVEDEDPDDNTIINLVQMTADRTNQFLFPEIPTFQTDPASAEDTPEEAWIKDFWEANGGLMTLAKLGLRGFLSGHSFARLKPPAKTKSRRPQFPKFLVLDPTSVLVYWRADDVADVLWYELRYVVGSAVYIQDFVKDEEDEDQWLIYTYRTKEPNNAPTLPSSPTRHGAQNVFALDVLGFQEGQFEQVGDVAIHGFHIPPIIEFPHLPDPDDYYGMGEFTQKRLQDTINRIASERNRIVRENADPVDVLTGAAADEVQDEGSIISIDNPMAKVTRLEMKGDMQGITAVLDKLIETYLAIARVVLLKGEAKDLQRVTNASVRTLFLDMLSKNNVLQSSYGAGLIKVVKLAMAMDFASDRSTITLDPDEAKVTIKFATALPIDKTEIAQQNAIQVGMGARSLRTAATEMGDEWAFEKVAIDEDQAAKEAKMVREGEIAATNAKAMSEAVPQQAPAGGDKPTNKTPTKN